MKRWISVILVFWALVSPSHLAFGQDNGAALTLMTYNIRCGFCEKPQSPNHWSKRSGLLIKQIKAANPDILAVQEAEEFQTLQIGDHLSAYGFYGLGREENYKGERNAIFYRKDRFVLISARTLWLNETGQEFVLGWDAKYRRTLTILVLFDLKTQKKIMVLNAHLDNEGHKARFEAAKIIAAQIAASPDMRHILMGDFNDRPGFDGHQALETQLMTVSPMDNTLTTFNGFDLAYPRGNIIDYIMVDKGARVMSSQINSQTPKGKFASDHFPIISTVVLP